MSRRRRPMTLPETAGDFARARQAFAAWLAERGSAVHTATNPYEVIRFAGVDGPCIVYRNEHGKITKWMNGADVAFHAFLTSGEWRAVTKTARGKKTGNLIASLAARDGWTCCYCPATLDAASATIEHFVPITAGGTNHMANLSLACATCNKLAGHRPVREKLEMAITRRKDQSA